MIFLWIPFLRCIFHVEVEMATNSESAKTTTWCPFIGLKGSHRLVIGEPGSGMRFYVLGEGIVTDAKGECTPTRQAVN